MCPLLVQEIRQSISAKVSALFVREAIKSVNAERQTATRFSRIGLPSLPISTRHTIKTLTRSPVKADLRSIIRCRTLDATFPFDPLNGHPDRSVKLAPGLIRTLVFLPAFDMQDDYAGVVFLDVAHGIKVCSREVTSEGTPGHRRWRRSRHVPLRAISVY